MTKFEKKLFIKAPAEKVWAFVSDPENLMYFIPAPFKKTIKLKPPKGKIARGTTFAWVVNIEGFEYAISGEVTAWLDGKGVTYQSTSGPRIEASFVLSSEKGGTKLWATVEYALPFSMIGMFLGKPDIEKDVSEGMEKAFTDLKKRLEGK
jgi:ligand-binding SRPBCC domain-containing protein